MKILFISGSPRKQGNTAKIIDKIRDQIQSTYKVEICYLTDYKINGCLGCSHCQSVLNQLGCIQNDQAELLLHQLIQADVIIYGTPLYGHSYSGQLKIFMDRHVSLFKFISDTDKAVGDMTIHSFIAGKPVGLIVSCQGPEEDNTELIRAQFDKFCESSLAQCIGQYIFPWCDPTTEQSEYAEETLQLLIHDIQRVALS